MRRSGIASSCLLPLACAGLAGLLGCAVDDAGLMPGADAGVAGTGGAPASGGIGGAPGVGGARGTGGMPGTGGGGPGSGGAAGARGGTGGVRGTGGGTAGSTGGGTGGASSTGTGGRSAGSGGAIGTGGRSAGAGGTQSDGGTPPNITVWIAGDSTVANGSAPCPIGWGGQIKPYFDSRVTVTNSAVAGRSVRTWLYSVQTTMDSTGECVLDKDSSGNPILQAHWQAMLTGMKTGDYLFIQFGINDSDPMCDRHVGTEAFKTSYGMMAQAAKDRGAHPIFVTPVSSISCSGSTAVGTREPYVTATRQAGTQYDVPVIDLRGLSVALYNAMGFCPIPGGGDVTMDTGGAVGAFFCADHTHFEMAGAVQLAGVIAQALRDQAIGLAAYLK